MARFAPLPRAWVLLSLALSLHVADEALTGFLSVYNPTVLELQRRLGWWPMPTFTYEVWLYGLIIGVIVLLALTPFASRNARAWRVGAYVFAVIMGANAVAHTIGTIFGRTFPHIQFARPMPGFYSSPFMFAAAAYLFIQLKKTGQLRQTA